MSFIGVFSILKCKTLVLKTTTRWKRASHFIDGWHLLRWQIRFFPNPLNGLPDHWTFVGEWGMGDFIDLVWGRIFSQTSLELEIFSRTYNGVRFFFRIIRHWRYFFSTQDIYFPKNIFACFFVSKSVCSTFFLKSPITPSKLKWSAPKIQQTSGQLRDSWNNREQNSLGRGGNSFLLTPTRKACTDIQTNERMDSLSYFIK